MIVAAWGLSKTALPGKGWVGPGNGWRPVRDSFHGQRFGVTGADHVARVPPVARLRKVSSPARTLNIAVRFSAKPSG